MRPPRTIPAPRHNRGFTIMELMVAIMVLGLLTSLALPSFRAMVVGQRVKSATFDMMSMIIFARSEAIKRNTTVTVNQVGGNFVVTAAGSATPLLSQEAFTGVSMQCIPNPPNCPAAGLVYNNSGRLVSAFPPLELDVDNPAATPNVSYKRCISIDLSGRPKSKKGACP